MNLYRPFGIYKSIICSAYPNRRNELGLYERDIVDMASRYPGKGFYEYHRQFSPQAAAHLHYNNSVVDWSVRNNSTFCNIFANLKPNTCNLCNSTLHTSAFCPKLIINRQLVQQGFFRNSKLLRQEQDLYSYGRERVFHLGKEICNNFNGERGCFAPRCNNLHVCLICKKEHSQSICPFPKNEMRWSPKKK